MARRRDRNPALREAGLLSRLLTSDAGKAPSGSTAASLLAHGASGSKRLRLASRGRLVQRGSQLVEEDLFRQQIEGGAGGEGFGPRKSRNRLLREEEHLVRCKFAALAFVGLLALSPVAMISCDNEGGEDVQEVEKDVKDNDEKE
jgi:hypothetical protein